MTVAKSMWWEMGLTTGWRPFSWAFYSFWGAFFFRLGGGAQELGTVTRIVVAGRAIAKRRTIVAFGLLLCCHGVSKVSTVTGIGGVLVAKLRTVVAFGFACCPRISEELHIFVLHVFAFSLELFFRGRSLEFGL